MSRKRRWKTVICPECYDDMIRFYRQDDRMKYAYASQASYAHPDHAPGSVKHDKVWFAFDLLDDLGSGPEWLDLQCKCRARTGSTVSVELGQAYEAAKATERHAVPVGEIAEQR